MAIINSLLDGSELPQAHQAALQSAVHASRRVMRVVPGLSWGSEVGVGGEGESQLIETRVEDTFASSSTVIPISAQQSRDTGHRPLLGSPNT